MTTTIQQYILSLLNHLNTSNSINFETKVDYFHGDPNARYYGDSLLYIVQFFYEYEFKLKVANYMTMNQFFILCSAEFILFTGIIILLIILGFNFSKLTIYQLIIKLSNYSKVFLFISLISLSVTFIYMHKTTNIDWLHGISLLNHSYKLDIATQLIKLVIILISLFLLAFINIATTATINPSMIELPLLLHIAISLSFIMVSCGNFIVLLLALESFSLILYILTTIERVYGGITAAVKYFSFGTLGSIFLFWGVVHLYTIVPSFSYKLIFFLTEISSLNVSDFTLFNSIEFATTSIILGFIIKLGAAPLHQWVADVYAGSHMFVTAIFATLVKFILFILFLRIAYFSYIGIMLDFIILSSLIIGCFMTLQQTELKRFLAYSSIVHIGFLFMGDIISSLLYISTYILSNLVFFSVLLCIRINGKELIYLNDLSFIRQSSYKNMILIIFALASAAGLPPFAGFYGKFFVWISLFEDIYLYNNFMSYIILLVSIIFSLIIIFYYMRVIAYIFIGNDIQHDVNFIPLKINEYKNTDNQNFNLQFIQWFSALLLLFWTVIQGNFMYLLNLISSSLMLSFTVL